MTLLTTPPTWRSLAPVAAALAACGHGTSATAPLDAMSDAREAATNPPDASLSETSTDGPSDPVSDGADTLHRYIYAALLGGDIGIYDLDHGHALVKKLTGLGLRGSGVDVRGMCGNALRHALYLSYMSSNGGHVLAVDLLSGAVLWHQDVSPGVDRGDIGPLGDKLYVPTNENNGSDDDLVLDPADGSTIGQVVITPKTHDTDVGVSGLRAYMETKSSSSLAVVDTATDRVLETIGPFDGVLGPHAVNGRDTLVVANVFGYFGFEVGDVLTGGVVAKAAITSIPDPGGTGLRQHGVAWKPNETEVWVTGGPYMHVFDMTVMPPSWKRDVPLIGYGDTHWVTFSIDGAYAYPSAVKNSGTPVQVIDTASYTPIATIDYSEDLFEVDVARGAVVAVGDEYGVGRVR